jgi:type VI protein secretion system component VasK
LLRVAFYQGDKLGTQAARAYRNALRDVFVAHLAVSLENALRADPDATLVEGYASLHDEAKRDAKVIEKAALLAWKLPDSAAVDLGIHLREALAERPLVLPRGRDDALIGQPRDKT